MARPRPTAEALRDLELEVARHKAVLSEFPEALVNNSIEFQSKEVNRKYNKFEFERNRWGIWVIPYSEVSFTFDNKIETVKIYSKPRRSRLVYLDWDRDGKNYIIRFSKFTFNLKVNNFKDDVLNACRIEIMAFIKENPKYKMDDKHLEPRLKKLLIFS